MNEADSDSRMNILFVHENTGPSGGAETNIQITAEELQRRGHRLGLLYSSPKKQAAWQTVFPMTFCLRSENAAETPNPKLQTPKKSQAPNSESWLAAHKALQEFRPDIIYVHKVRDLDMFEALLGTGVPVVRMVHDHEMYCLRQYKYNPLTRAI